MAGTFEPRMRELAMLVGRGRITARTKFDQIYARRQHQTASFAHPNGGEAFFLRNHLQATANEHLQVVAMQLFRGNVQARFIEYAEKLSKGGNVPAELGTLRGSGSAEVLVGGAYIYRRPARIRRMSRRELNSRIRRPRRR